MRIWSNLNLFHSLPLAEAQITSPVSDTLDSYSFVWARQLQKLRDGNPSREVQFASMDSMASAGDPPIEVLMSASDRRQIGSGTSKEPIANESSNKDLESDWDSQYFFIQRRVNTFLKEHQHTDCLFYLELCLTEVLGCFEELSRPVLQLQLLLAKTYFESGQWIKANEVYESVHSQLGYETGLQNRDVVGFLMEYASTQLELSRGDDEIHTLLNQAHSLVCESNDLGIIQFYSKTMITFVNECFIQDYYSLGYAWMSEAVETAEWYFGMKSIEYADAVMGRSRMYADLGDDLASLHDSETAVEILYSMHSSGNSNLALTRLLSLGQEFNQVKNYEMAIRCFTRATDFTRISNVTEAQHRVIGDLSLARVYSSRDDHAMSLHHLLAALHILDKQGCQFEEIRINVLQDLHKIYETTGDHFNAKRVTDELKHIRFLLRYAAQQKKLEA